MKRWAAGWLFLIVIAFTGCSRRSAVEKGEQWVAASDSALRYEGRWDVSDLKRPRASWPGFAVSVDFQGRSLKVRMTDAGNFYNVEVDGKFHAVIGGQEGLVTYPLAENLADGVHRVRLQRRNISFEAATVIEGFLVDDAARLSRPTEEKRLRIEFIGDSYTAAEGNEATTPTLPWKEKYRVTNFSLGYAAEIGRLLDAEVTAVCRSGSGLVCDYRGNRKDPMGERYGWTLMEKPEPKWKFAGPSPDVVVISLGLNDFSGLKGPDGKVAEAATGEFREAYRRLIGEIRRRHPKARMVALASHNLWAREATAAVVSAERAAGRTDVEYAQFDDFPGGYVADGHPTVETHRKMAEQIVARADFLRKSGDSQN
jgi:hypothetical protein